MCMALQLGGGGGGSPRGGRVKFLGTFYALYALYVHGVCHVAAPNWLQGGGGRGGGGRYEDGGVAVWDLRWEGRAVGRGKVHEEPGEGGRLGCGCVMVHGLFRFLFLFCIGALICLSFLLPLPCSFVSKFGEDGVVFGGGVWLKPFVCECKKWRKRSLPRLI